LFQAADSIRSPHAEVQRRFPDHRFRRGGPQDVREPFVRQENLPIGNAGDEACVRILVEKDLECFLASLEFRAHGLRPQDIPKQGAAQ
jgi:hypothetical protein